MASIEIKINRGITSTTHGQERLWRGKLLPARIAVCGTCGNTSQCMVTLGLEIRRDVKPLLEEQGWVLHVPGGWTCPECESKVGK